MHIPEYNHKLTGNGYKAVNGCKAVDGSKAKIGTKAENDQCMSTGNVSAYFWSALSWLLPYGF